ncbi:MAG: alpha/beta hydrolase [Deltaproteobacteria bacterium]|nr:alpha/beta hydrolase [Deltaproteobacteria bacterium]
MKMLRPALATLLILPQLAHAMGKTQPPPVDSIAANVRIVVPTGHESCSVDAIPTAPSGLTEENGRLIPALRALARQADPMTDLVASAKQFALENEAFARAAADLAITGLTASQRFVLDHAQGSLTEESLVAQLVQDPELSWLSRDALLEASRRALDRAYAVARALPFGNSPERKHLGWIALSSEDDPPYRPVNISSSEYAQRDLTVQVGSHPVRTRYIVADGLADPEPAPVTPPRQLPAAHAPPRLDPNAKVVLFIHGMDSRVEEATGLIHAMHQIGRANGENWTVVAMDFPTAGYADRFDPSAISPISDLGRARRIVGFDARGTQRVPLLDFMEDFIVAFVDRLDREIPLKRQLVGVIGGSFGGNMTFRLGRRTDLPWLKNIVTWSPASIWTGLADGADIFKQLGVTAAWKRAGGDASLLEETEGRRAEFFDQAFNGAVNIGPVHVVPAQPEQWWSRSWPCFDRALVASRLERHESYARDFRLWHWRLGAEQLIYSHQSAPDHPTPRWRDNHVRMLLATGQEDDFNFTNIFSSTRKTAHQMRGTPGQALLFAGTGHSIHVERPALMARKIVEFLRGSKP